MIFHHIRFKFELVEWFVEKDLIGDLFDIRSGIGCQSRRPETAAGGVGKTETPGISHHAGQQSGRAFLTKRQFQVIDQLHDHLAGTAAAAYPRFTGGKGVAGVVVDADEVAAAQLFNGEFPAAESFAVGAVKSEKEVVILHLTLAYIFEESGKKSLISAGDRSGDKDIGINTVSPEKSAHSERTAHGITIRALMGHYQHFLCAEQCLTDLFRGKIIHHFSPQGHPDH